MQILKDNLRRTHVANIKSAKKRILVNQRQKSENKFLKATINTYIKKFRKLVSDGKFDEAEVQLKETVSLINSSASKGVFHKNNASRKVSRLSQHLHQAKNGKHAPAPKPVKKAPVVVETPVEKPAPVVEAPVATEKPAPAKKPAAAKTTTAKPAAAKKAPAKAEEKPAKVKKKTVAKKPAAKKVETAEKPAPAKKPAAAKTTTAKPAAAKKAPAKKVGTAEKPAAKKAPAKKPAAK